MRFIGRAYLNRRYTRLIPSCVLAAATGALYVFAALGSHNSQRSPLGVVVDVLLVAAAVVLYPFAREIYFRITAPIRQSMPALVVPLVVLAVIYIFKLWVCMILMLLSIPLGLVGFAYLSVTERRGTASYRLT